ncbi:MAG: PEP-CTERM sorting domain-containing protein [Bryobacteraceae bacterium]|nr:PEP-CTERM sorting domain-containing protein [Bryobacteraceae bacterium]MDW8377375.1 PEP-CTERM sorting domain-containing protein [Bryobacterales bacterium]
MSVRKLTTVLFFVALPVHLPANVIVPPGFGAVEGNSGQITAIATAPRTFQAVLSSSFFTGFVGQFITGIRYRLETGTTTWPPGNVTFANYDMVLSTSLNPPGSLSNVFANNIGPDAVTVRSGPLTIPAGSFPGGTGPNPFGFLINFTQPYLYQGGDLLITIRHTGRPGTDVFLDAETSGTNVLYQTIGAQSYNATTVDLSLRATPIMLIEFQPTGEVIPEPGTVSLISFGIVALLMLSRRRWRLS